MCITAILAVFTSYPARDTLKRQGIPCSLPIPFCKQNFLD